MADRAPGPEAYLAQKILSQVFASGRPWPVLMVALVATALSLFGSSLYELLQWQDDGHEMGWIHLSVGLLTFPLLLVPLLWLARRERQRMRPTVDEEASPPEVRGLILYLSTLNGNYSAELARQLGTEGLDLDGFRRGLGQSNWRMPVEAVAYHRRRLSRVVVIPSSGGRGSLGQVDLFRRLLAALFPESRFQCLQLGECCPDYAGGLDFESGTDRLARATDDAYEHLRGLGLPSGDILIDITGGTKPTTVVGSAVALAEGRRIQYVSTSDYAVRVYDVRYGS